MEVLCFTRTEPRQSNSKPDNLYWDHIEALPDAAFAHDGIKIIFANQAAVNLFGAQSHNDLIGRKLLSILHPENKEFVQKKMTVVGEMERGSKHTEENI